ncbi:DUF2269 family protein [Magnetofaba australis]|uniref:Putative transmembrane protein n=1 Tax=Magnetofaba australis IT-1 TaxID=1434232 RepID=A0A1Y2KA60_9PROT|nr:DUF2269 domain-containing protein [Magnetofaba australis]OSM06251.1 putative transmembrane protein [Magnetofaba australis IT-1]
MLSETLRWAHILGAIVLFGTGLGTAFHGWRGNLNPDVRVKAAINDQVVLADWLFTTPAVILQPITGVLLARELGWSLTEGWILLSAALYVLAGACWLPVVWLQLRMRKLSAAAAREGRAVEADFRRAFRLWFWLGWPAFVSMTAIVWLMATRPAWVIVTAIQNCTECKMFA